jgi:two-component system, sensor histidine kinase and response regulator
VKFTERGEVVLAASMDGTLVRFAIHDTGIGIPPEKQALIFQPFSQADASTTRKYGGTGLGLSISRQLIELMGGRIWVESVPGQGTTVLFTVRLAPAPAPPPIPALAVPVHLSCRVLVVDDNATNRRILEKQLTRWGAAPVMADGGGAALGFLDQAARPFDLIITDCHMPAMDGFQFVAELHRRWPDYRGRVLMLSSASNVGDASRCQAIGVSRHIIKPAKGADLLSAIVRMLGEAGAAANPPAPPQGLPAAAGASARPLRVLLAEDNPVNQRMAQLMLERLGHSVKLASSGTEVLRAWRPGRYDLILMDVQMPGMDGFEATAAIRAQSGATPIIALTAHAMAGDRERCLRNGMDGYLQKPIRPDELNSLLSRYSAEHRPAQ